VNRSPDGRKGGEDMNRIEIATLLTALKELLETGNVKGALKVVDVGLNEALSKPRHKEQDNQEE
jgi:hypothetical protein